VEGRGWDMGGDKIPGGTYPRRVRSPNQDATRRSLDPEDASCAIPQENDNIFL
jgi:hypothetical protein